MSEQTSEEEATPTTDAAEQPEPSYPTGYHVFDKQQVRVQLVHPYVTGVGENNGEQQLFATEILHGKLRVQRGDGQNLLLVLGTIQEDSEHVAQVLISLHPEDVKHITMVTDVQQKPRLHVP